MTYKLRLLPVWFAGSLLIVVLSCASASPQKADALCQDSDVDDAHPDGNNLAVAGGCSSRIYSGSPFPRIGFSDLCTYEKGRAGRLHESMCLHDQCVRDENAVECPTGSICRAGACVHGDPEDPICVETDQGGDVFVAGTVTSLTQTGAADTCYLSSQSDMASGTLVATCQPGVPVMPTSKETFCGVYEAACTGPDTSAYTFILCSHGCKRGACISEK
jgi:hypothetical protein